MRPMVCPQPNHAGFFRAGCLTAGLLAFAVMSAAALAEQGPGIGKRPANRAGDPGTQSKPEPKKSAPRKAKPDPSVKAGAKAKNPLPTRPGAKINRKRSSKLANRNPAARSTLVPDPNAKWVCDKPVVIADPVWRGQKALTFNFDIRNEGTADLKFNARGG